MKTKAYYIESPVNLVNSLVLCVGNCAFYQYCGNYESSYHCQFSL